VLTNFDYILTVMSHTLTIFYYDKYYTIFVFHKHAMILLILKEIYRYIFLNGIQPPNNLQNGRGSYFNFITIILIKLILEYRYKGYGLFEIKRFSLGLAEARNTLIVYVIIVAGKNGLKNIVYNMLID